jgi:hypothetical protein
VRGLPVALGWKEPWFETIPNRKRVSHASADHPRKETAEPPKRKGMPLLRECLNSHEVPEIAAAKVCIEDER